MIISNGTLAILLTVILMVLFAAGLWNSRPRRRAFGQIGRIPSVIVGFLMPTAMRQRHALEVEDRLMYLNDPLRASPWRYQWLQGAGLVLGVLLACAAAGWLSEAPSYSDANLPGMTVQARQNLENPPAPSDFVLTVAVVLSLLLGFLGWRYPSLALKRRVEQRKQRLLLQLADLLELMAITMRAGAEFDQALETAGRTIYDRYIQKPDQYPLGIELAQALFERNMGVSRADFMESLGLRATMRKERDENEFSDAAVTLWDELTQAVTLSQEVGSSLRDTLPDIVERVRSGRLKAAEQTAAGARITIVYPQSLLVLALMITLLASVGLFVSNLSLTP